MGAFGENQDEKRAEERIDESSERTPAERIEAVQSLIESLEEKLAEFYHEANVHFMDEDKFTSIARHIVAIKAELRHARRRLSEYQAQIATLN